MNLEGIMLNELIQTEKGKYSVISLTHGVLKTGTHRNRRNRERLGCGVGGCWSKDTTSSCGMNKFQESDIRHGDCS